MTAPGTSDRLDPRLMRIAAVLLLGVLAPMLDSTIVNVALETLGRALHAGVGDVQWVTTGYLLAMSMVIPVSGWATERFGARQVWITSLLVFLAGSMLSGVAWNLGSLVAFRVLQGCGTGLLVPVMQTVLFRAAGGRPSGKVLSLISLPVLVGPVLGPVAGGLLLDHLDWRWIFYVNVPICIAAIVLSLRLLPVDAPRRVGPLDLTGLALLPPAMAAIAFGLARAGLDGGFGAPAASCPLIAGALLLAAFVVHALRTAEPLVDLRLLRNRWFATSAGVLFLTGLSMFAAMLLLPLYYQQVRHESVLAAGLLLAPQGLGTGVARAAGALVDRVGPRVMIIVGITVTALGTAPFAYANERTPEALLAVALLVRGIGLGAATIAVLLSAYTGLRNEQIPHASSLTRILQQLGGSFGTAVLAVMLQSQVSGSAGSAGSAGRGAILASAFQHTFTVALALTALALIPALLLPRGTGLDNDARRQETDAPRTSPAGSGSGPDSDAGSGSGPAPIAGSGAASGSR